jgi:hypothetical protein
MIALWSEGGYTLELGPRSRAWINYPTIFAP